MTPDDRALAELVRVCVDGGPAPAAPSERVRRHGLAPLAFTHGRTEYRADYATSAIRADQQRALATEAVAALAPIPALLLKGISYAGWLYADAGERPMSDIDLLVPAADHPAAVRALTRIGYWHPGPAVQRSPRHHAMTLKRLDSSIDLHRDVAQRGRLAIDWPGVWARSAPTPWIPGARRPDTLDTILFHFAHLVRQDLIAPLLTMVDAGRLLRDVDLPALRDRARLWDFSRILDRCLEVLDGVLGRGPARARWWLPDSGDLLRRDRPARSVQIGRKIMLLEGPRAALAMGAAVLDGLRFS